jgi:hypothetical protein
MQTIKEVFAICLIACVAMFVPLTAAHTGHNFVAFGSVPFVILYISIGAELLTEYSSKHWKE